jgi:hypothetical protein
MCDCSSRTLKSVFTSSICFMRSSSVSMDETGVKWEYWKWRELSFKQSIQHYSLDIVQRQRFWSRVVFDRNSAGFQLVDSVMHGRESISIITEIECKSYADFSYFHLFEMEKFDHRVVIVPFEVKIAIRAELWTFIFDIRMHSMRFDSPGSARMHGKESKDFPNCWPMIMNSRLRGHWIQ